MFGDRASAGRIGNHAFFFFLILVVVVVDDDDVVSSVSTVDCKAGDVLDDDVLMVMAAKLNDWKDVADDNNKSSCNIIGIIILTWRRLVILFICCGLVVLFYSDSYIHYKPLIVTHR